MRHPDDNLVTPIYVKSDREMPWPEGETAFHLLTSSGLYLCRNHPFFRSCVPAAAWPSELAEQQSFLELHYPKIPRRRFELIVGFFARVAERHGSEAAVLMVWDARGKRVRFVVPEQVATVSKNWWGDTYPIGLHYQVPTDLPAGWTVIGDIHSHVDDPAYASGTDKDDETHRAGLHIVVGRISREPPDLYIAAVVDGTRFRVDPTAVIAGYRQRRLRVPSSWLERVKIEPPSWKKKDWGSSADDRRGTALTRSERTFPKEQDAVTPGSSSSAREGNGHETGTQGAAGAGGEA
jgi:hypothetical protein